MATEMLAGRQARCTCGETAPSEEVRGAFFEYRGEGSFAATETCGNCYYHKGAHGWGLWATCAAFTPRGPMAYDSFFCGHVGGSEAPER